MTSEAVAPGGKSVDFWRQVDVYRNARRSADHARFDWDRFMATRPSSSSEPPPLDGAVAALKRLRDAEDLEAAARDALAEWIRQFGR